MGPPSTATNVIAAAVKIMRPALCPISVTFAAHAHSNTSSATTRKMINLSVVSGQWLVAGRGGVMKALVL